jgi:hypothetical protein
MERDLDEDAFLFARKTEISKLEQATLVYQQILRLDVAVYDVAQMEIA